MKEMNPNTQDGLDRLLASAPMPKAPAWFEARTLARLRREKELPGLWSRILAVLQNQERAVIVARLMTLAVFALVACFFWHSVLKPEPRRYLADRKMFDAFSAFTSYTTEQENWNNSGF